MKGILFGLGLPSLFYFRFLCKMIIVKVKIGEIQVVLKPGLKSITAKFEKYCSEKKPYQKRKAPPSKRPVKKAKKETQVQATEPSQSAQQPNLDMPRTYDLVDDVLFGQ